MIVGLMSSLLLAASANAAITYKMYRDAKKAEADAHDVVV